MWWHAGLAALWVSLDTVLVGPLVSVLTDFSFMSLDALVTKLAEALLVVQAQLQPLRRG